MKTDNILIHKYIKTYLKIIRILCNYLKNNRIKQRITATKIRKQYKTYCQSALNLTQNSLPEPPTKNQQNHKTEMKTRVKTLVFQPYCETENACNAPNSMCDKKGGCAQKLCLKSSSPSEKIYIFLKQKLSS